MKWMWEKGGKEIKELTKVKTYFEGEVDGRKMKCLQIRRAIDGKTIWGR
jgi:hypothetical protein